MDSTMPVIDPQGGSSSGSSNGDDGAAKKKKHKSLPPLFLYMETGDWERATDRAKQYPREARTWATLRTKSMADAGTHKVSGTKRLALHHACFKLRSVETGTDSTTDPFIEVCNFIMLLLELYPEAAGQRESRHGCLPLHLAAFASCSPKQQSTTNEETAPVARPVAVRSLSLASGTLPKPAAISYRTNSESTTDTNMSAVLAEEKFAGKQTMQRMPDFLRPPDSPTTSSQSISVSRKSNMVISSQREEMAVQVLNALLDAYPKGIRVDSEGGRLPLHTACAGRATTRVISTLITAYPAAARHRNKDGFLPLHLAAHWGVTHPNVAILLLKSYPDATLGRNRWERTPLEEALCMAGENGRSHQAALVRALRKHPSYWSRPPADVFSSKPRGNNIVDMDETVDDSTNTSSEDDRFGPPNCKEGRASHFSPRLLSLKGRKTEPLAVTDDLPTLIKNQNWSGVIDRLDINPNESSEQLRLHTRGGFIAVKGLTPLAYALERNPPVEVAEALIEAAPESVGIKVQPGGALPLHIACTWHANPSVVSVLLQTEPAACRVPDELGNVPLHSACFSGATAPVVDALLHTYPKAALIRNHQGSLPSDICKRLRHENRKLIMSLLNNRKEELVVNHHRRSRSSESHGIIAQRAAELNEREVPASKQQLDVKEGHDEIQDVGVEVTFEGGDEGLLWI